MWVFCISCTYKVSFYTFCNSRFWNFCSNFSFSYLCMANSCDNLEILAVVDVDSMVFHDELGSMPTTAIGTAMMGSIMASCAASFSFHNSSICSSIFFNYIFYSMIILSISSFCCSFSAISFVRGSSFEGSYNGFFNATMSASFFLRSSSTTFTSLGSYPTLITKSSNAFILLSLGKEEKFSDLS